MHDDAFDLAVRAHARSIPRRGLLGLAAGLTALALGRPETEARRKKRKKRKKCKKGTTKCDKACVNLTTDNVNCGACGVACTSGQTCSAGACACPAGQSFVAGACIPRFGCTLNLDTCELGKTACPDFPIPTGNTCFVTEEGEPFCGTDFDCSTLAPGATCAASENGARIFIPCAICIEPGQTGACVKPTVQGPV